MGLHEGGGFQIESLEKINEIGVRLSKELGCPIFYPAFEKKLFACIRHHVTFPYFRLMGSDDWSWIHAKHEAEMNLPKGEEL